MKREREQEKGTEREREQKMKSEDGLKRENKRNEERDEE